MRRYGLVDIPDQASDIDAVPITRTITINGVTYDLSADRTWTSVGTNIYNTDGTLTANRTLTHSTFSLTFAGTTSSRFHSNGNVTIGKTSDNGNKLQVLGQADFGDIGVSNKGVVVYGTSVTQSLGVFRGPILMWNLSDVFLNIDCGGSNALGSQPVKIYTSIIAPVTNQFPLCIQGNGYETIFGQDTITTNASSLVTMVSTTKGFLPPRMTSAQRTAIGSPATGLVVYQTDGSAGLYLRNSGAWVLLGTGTGNGTVTSVSVVTANGLAGTVATATTTPAITLSTTVTGLLKGNGTAISAATAGTDYQAPITLTTSGTSGAATLISNTLNIPNYSSGTAASGTYTPTISSQSNCSIFTTYVLHYFQVGDVVHVAGKITFSPSTTTNTFGFKMSIPVNTNLSVDSSCGGTCVRELATSGGGVSAGSIQGGGNNLVEFFFATANSTAITDWYFTYTYIIGGL